MINKMLFLTGALIGGAVFDSLPAVIIGGLSAVVLAKIFRIVRKRI